MGLRDLEFFYIDEENDEIMLVNDEDVSIMKEDFHCRADTSKAQKILVKTKVDSIMDRKAKKDSI